MLFLARIHVVCADGVISNCQTVKKYNTNAKSFSRWEFLVSVQPLKIDKGTGSPVNIIAFFYFNSGISSSLSSGTSKSFGYGAIQHSLKLSNS